MEKKEY
jgi:Ca2+-dependent lipid-binding protein